jgi:hypothetical protein
MISSGSTFELCLVELVLICRTDCYERKVLLIDGLIRSVSL